MDMAKKYSWKGKKILITGVNGFVGIHLAKMLLSEGAIVEGTAREGSTLAYLRAAGMENTFPLHAVDVTDALLVDKVVRAGSYDVIFHLASQSDTWKSISSPYETMQTNVLGTLNVLESVRKLSRKPRMVLAGTVRAFYNSQNEDAVEGMHPYDASKTSMESIALSYFNAYDIPGAVAKNTNIYGENDLNFSRLIPLLMKQVLVEKKIKLKGDGSARRDFMHVSDAVNALVTLAEHLDSSTVRGRMFTFATGKAISIREVCAVIKRLAGETISEEFDEHETLVERNQPELSVGRTSNVLGWKSRISFEKGVEQTISWYRDYFRRR